MTEEARWQGRWSTCGSTREEPCQQWREGGAGGSLVSIVSPEGVSPEDLQEPRRDEGLPLPCPCPRTQDPWWCHCSNILMHLKSASSRTSACDQLPGLSASRSHSVCEAPVPRKCPCVSLACNLEALVKPSGPSRAGCRIWGLHRMKTWGPCSKTTALRGARCPAPHPAVSLKQCVLSSVSAFF